LKLLFNSPDFSATALWEGAYQNFNFPSDQIYFP